MAVASRLKFPRGRIDPVWELYREAHRLTGGAATLLEWDAKIPEFPVVHAEVHQLQGESGAECLKAPFFLA